MVLSIIAMVSIPVMIAMAVSVTIMMMAIAIAVSIAVAIPMIVVSIVMTPIVAIAVMSAVVVAIVLVAGGCLKVLNKFVILSFFIVGDPASADVCKWLSVSRYFHKTLSYLLTSLTLS